MILVKKETKEVKINLVKQKEESTDIAAFQGNDIDKQQISQIVNYKAQTFLFLKRTYLPQITPFSGIK